MRSSKTGMSDLPPALHQQSTAERRRTERALWRRALAGSLLLHLIVVLAWPVTSVIQSPFAAAGPRAGDNQAASGSLQALNLTVPPSRPIVPPRVPTISLDAVEPVEFDESAELQPSQFVGNAPGLEGPGLAAGQGQGDGGASDEGNFRMVPAVPRGMILPPPSDKLDVLELEVWVFVDAAGRVIADSTVLRPPTSDRDFNRRLIRDAADWVFEPARQGGEPVASWFPYRIVR